MLFSTAFILNSIGSFFSEYGNLVLILALSAMTIFRREISCNHCYVEEVPSEESSSTENSNPDWDDAATEEILEGAGSCSTTSLLDFLARIFRALPRPPSLKSMLVGPSDLDNQSPEDLLEKAGCYYAGYPFTASLLQSRALPSVVRRGAQPVDPGFLPGSLPLEIQMNVLMFLGPRDLVNVACLSRSSRKLVEEGETSRVLWKENFDRDYGWLINNWSVGMEAVKRSQRQICFTKDFYFRFGISYLNYMLAGQNTHQRCLVGIGGHIYDMSLFLAVHPGSPDTVLAHAGMDASMVFTGVNHSLGALKMARSLCVAVDMSFVDRRCTRVCPTRSTAAQEMLTGHAAVPIFENSPETFHTRTEIRQKATLRKVRTEYQAQEAVVRRIVASMNADEIVGEINPYLDPVDNQWKAWYTTMDFQTVFVHDLPFDRRLVR